MIDVILGLIVCFFAFTALALYIPIILLNFKTHIEAKTERKPPNAEPVANQ
jgi:hypothetical protein